MDPTIAATYGLPVLAEITGRLAGSGCAAIGTKGNFARLITRNTGRVRAEARMVAQGRQIIPAEAKVLSRDGKVLAHGTSTIMVLAGAK